jgi:predicted DCC family thiol-disulfide oxidoreductase YuxK
VADTGPLLIYDGDCSFCSSSARWLTNRWAGPQRAAAWQHLSAGELEQLGLRLDDVRSAVWWTDPSTRNARGHLAIARALRAAPGWPSVVGRLLLVPPIRWLGAAAYPLVARWRHLLPGGTPACRLDAQSSIRRSTGRTP